jgi:hypothetical protein
MFFSLVVIPGRREATNPESRSYWHEIPGSPSKSAVADWDIDIAELG